MPLLTNLISYWKLDEASGSRADSHGTTTLSDNNTVTQNTGKLTSAAQFTAANSEYLSAADNANLSVGDIDFTIAAWVYLDSKTAARTIVGKYNRPASDREYLLQYSNSADRFRFFVSDDGSTDRGPAVANNLGSVSTGTWYFVVAWHDASANTLNIQVNNGTVDSVSYSSGVRNGTSNFVIGSIDNGSGDFMDGRIDGVGFWKRTLTADEKTALYNAGNGLDYPFGEGAIGATIFF